MTKYDLYFGRRKPDGFLVSPSAFQQFLVDKVNPRIRGYTVTPGSGYFDGVEEECWVLSIIAPDGWDEPLFIAGAYNRRFLQNSVLLTKTPISEVKLVEGETVPPPVMYTEAPGSQPLQQ